MPSYQTGKSGSSGWRRLKFKGRSMSRVAWVQGVLPNPHKQAIPVFPDLVDATHIPDAENRPRSSKKKANTIRPFFKLDPCSAARFRAGRPSAVSRGHEAKHYLYHPFPSAGSRHSAITAHRPHRHQWCCCRAASPTSVPHFIDWPKRIGKKLHGARTCPKTLPPLAVDQCFILGGPFGTK